MSDSEQDKKRNKLGYQRISIACAHCRRRKIRCLLAEKDPQGRCQNCIRLKKECIFYPIDQQGAYGSRSESSRRGAGSASSSGVSSTSPDVQALDGYGTGRSYFPNLAHGSAQGLQGMPVERGAEFQADRPYQETLPSNAPWPRAVSRGYEMQMQSHTTSPGQHQQPQYRTYDQSPGSGDFAPFPNDSAQQVRTPSTTFAATFEQQPSPELQWQLQHPHQAARSMTYPLPASAINTGLPPSVPSYASDASTQHLPPTSYPPFAVPLESPHMLRQVQGPPFPIPIPHSRSFTEHGDGGPYEYRGPHEHHHGAMPVQQGYPATWVSSPGLSFSVDEQQIIPSSAAPPQYVVPSQRPR